MSRFKELEVWQLSIELVVLIYEITKSFPASEQYGLVSQLRRSAVSVPSNIAEGNERAHFGDHIRFLSMASGSLAEVETQIIVARRLQYLGPDPVVDELIDHIGRKLVALRTALERKLDGAPKPVKKR